MHSNNKQRRGVRFEVLLLLCALCVGGCSRDDGRRAIIERTVIQLRAEAERWDASFSDEHARTYLAPAFRGAIPRLQKDGADALPVLLTATFAHGFDVPTNISGWSYVFCWLETGGQVRGFYLRSEGEPDVELHPVLSKEPQVEGTAWMMDGGPVLASAEKMSKVPTPLKARSIVVESRILARKKLLVGLILADGHKTAPIEAHIRQGDNRLFEGRDPVSSSSGNQDGAEKRTTPMPPRRGNQ